MNQDSTVQEAAYSLTIDRRAKAVVTGVEDVESFDEAQIAMHTVGGYLILTGSGLHVESLQLEQGRLTLTGRIDSAAYGDIKTRGKGGFLRRALGR